MGSLWVFYFLQLFGNLLLSEYSSMAGGWFEYLGGGSPTIAPSDKDVKLLENNTDQVKDLVLSVKQLQENLDSHLTKIVKESNMTFGEKLKDGQIWPVIAVILLTLVGVSSL